MKHTYTEIPIWNRKFLLVTGCTRNELLSLISKYKLGRDLRKRVYDDPPFPIKEGQGCVYMDDVHCRYIMYFPNRKVRNDTIIHETNHIAKHLMKYLGAQQEKEGQAYTQEWLYNWVRKNI